MIYYFHGSLKASYYNGLDKSVNRIFHKSKKVQKNEKIPEILRQSSELTGLAGDIILSA